MNSYAINEVVVLLPENIEAVVLGTVGGQAIVKAGALGTMQVPFRRLLKKEEAIDAEEIAPAPAVPPPSDLSVSDPPEPVFALDRPLDTGVEDPPVPLVSAGLKEVLDLPLLPARMSKKWLSEQSTDTLKAILEKVELTPGRRKSIEKHLKERD